MRDIRTPTFIVSDGYGKVVCLSRGSETDKLALLYHPKIGADAEDLVPFILNGDAVTLDTQNPLAVLVMPGTYQIIALGGLSPNADIDVSDGPGFRVQLVTELKNVVS